MIRIEQNELQWLEFELLAEHPEVVHGVFTRHGGVSKDHLASLNLGKSVGDSPENVEINFHRIKTALSLSNILSAQLVHKDVIVSVSSSANEIPSCDGLVIQERGTGLMVSQADCQAAIFYDPIHQVLANVHCGWRGHVQNIYKKTICCLQAKHASKPENLLVCISPSLGPEHAEFIHYKTEFPEPFWEFQLKPNYFNLWEIGRWQLTSSGVLPHHIQIACIDTFSSKEDFFSYRRERQCGRNATVCAIN